MPLRRRQQFTSIRYGERLAELGALPSIGTVGDSYDCDDPALPEATNSLYKTELIRQQGPWRGVDDVELAINRVSTRPSADQHSPTAIGKALGRSSDAVGNALIKLAGNGTITETSVKPRRYTVQP